MSNWEGWMQKYKKLQNDLALASTEVSRLRQQLSAQPVAPVQPSMEKSEKLIVIIKGLETQLQDTRGQLNQFNTVITQKEVLIKQLAEDNKRLSDVAMKNSSQHYIDQIAGM